MKLIKSFIIILLFLIKPLYSQSFDDIVYRDSIWISLDDNWKLSESNYNRTYWSGGSIIYFDKGGIYKEISSAIFLTFNKDTIGVDLSGGCRIFSGKWRIKNNKIGVEKRIIDWSGPIPIVKVQDDRDSMTMKSAYPNEEETLTDCFELEVDKGNNLVNSKKKLYIPCPYHIDEYTRNIFVAN